MLRKKQKNSFMKKLSRIIYIVGLLGIHHLLSPQTAHAYLDPGTGSYLFQILIAGLLGGAFALKIFWRRIWLFFSRWFSKKGDDDRVNK